MNPLVLATKSLWHQKKPIVCISQKCMVMDYVMVLEGVGVDQVLWKWESVCCLQLFLPTLTWSAGSGQQHKFTPSDTRK